MTRINVVDVGLLTDQHLMAEYRELPMVMTSAKRARVDLFTPSTKYTLNEGHVKFFWDKREFLERRWYYLIKELKLRGYQIDPDSRVVNWNALEKFEQVSWEADDDAIEINRRRIQEKIALRPSWYRYWGNPLMGNLDV